ncbi:MAG: PAS domain S-box protein [Pseudomonas sp.]|uniref:PAS domain-containing sensor histidine kinase n=1 Tax=Pseudomonas sp. TaxID=306 RepID=UPI003395D239
MSRWGWLGRLGVWLSCLLLPLGTVAASGLVLEPEQRAWLQEHRQLRVGLLLQAPYAQFDPRLQTLSGLNVELATWLAQALQVELLWQRYDSPEALQAAVRAGQVDLAPGLTQSPAGLRLWAYSAPYMRVPHLLVGARNGTTALDLDTLGGRQPIAVKTPSPAAEYLRGTYPNLELQAVVSERQALQALRGQRVSFAVVDQAQLSRLSRESEFAGLAVVGDIGLPQLLRVGSRRDWPELAAVVEAALRSLPAKDLEQLHGRWLAPKYPALDDGSALWRNLSLLLGGLLLLCLAAWALGRRQQRELEARLVHTRQALEAQAMTEAALRLSQFSIDQSTVGILWVNWDSHVRYANRAAQAMLGYGPEGVIERPLAEFEPSLSMDRWLALWRRARQTAEGPLNFETQCLRADGSLLPADVSVSFLRFREAEYLVVFLTDVTERRGAQAALQESEARLQGIAANVPGLVFRLARERPGASGEFAFISAGSETLVGYSASDLLAPDRGLRSLVHPEDRDSYHLSQDQALADDSDWHWQGRILTRAGEQRWADIRAVARRLEAGRVVWDGILWDISESKRIELALAESRTQLRDLSAHLETVREEEKAHIAREVHDELGQVLTVLKLETAMCELAYAELDPGLQGRLEHMKRLIAQLFQLVRDVATALRPPILDAGIASAIEWQAQRFEARSQIPCLVQVPEQLPSLADAKAVGLFRILQEALTNVLRHAQAHTVELSLTLEAGALCLRVSDDGCGFNLAAERPTSFGLVGMRERVLMLGGDLSLASLPGQGTQLNVRIPLD